MVELVECYDPYDTYWSAPEEPTPTAANRAALSASEFARASFAKKRAARTPRLVEFGSESQIRCDSLDSI
jgi:hypothetical protein